MWFSASSPMACGEYSATMCGPVIRKYAVLPDGLEDDDEFGVWTVDADVDRGRRRGCLRTRNRYRGDEESGGHQ
jgi:hypothetical protein